MSSFVDHLPVVLATRNRGKEREIAAMLGEVSIVLKTLDDVGYTEAIPETGATYAENALEKARTAHTATGLPALADDSGLECDALAGAPGVYSARFAGAQCTDGENNAKLLRAMEHIPDARRTARFRCVLAFIDDRGEHLFEGVCEGWIERREYGARGFGYDSVFIPHGYAQTFGTFTAALKNTMSHRAKAVALWKKYLADVTIPCPVL